MKHIYFNHINLISTVASKCFNNKNINLELKEQHKYPIIIFIISTIINLGKTGSILFQSEISRTVEAIVIYLHLKLVLTKHHIKMKTKYLLMSFVLFIAMLSACKKDFEPTPVSILETIDDSILKIYPIDTLPLIPDKGYPTTSYVSPELGTYLSSPTSSVTYNGIVYYGGPLQFKVNSITGNNIQLLVKRTDGQNFPTGSVLKIKLNNSGGNQVGITTTVTTPSSSINMNFNESVSWNLSNSGTTNYPNNFRLYCVTWYNPVSNLNFYTKPVRIVAVPTGWNQNIGTYNNVIIYSNGYGGFRGTDFLTYSYGQKYQCVEYVKRFYSVVKGKTIGNGDASTYWSNYSNLGFSTRVPNGTGIPQAGDVLVFQTHVAIIQGLSSPGVLRVWHQNVGVNLEANGNYCKPYRDFNFTITSNKYNISSTTSFGTCLGWLR